MNNLVDISDVALGKSGFLPLSMRAEKVVSVSQVAANDFEITASNWKHGFSEYISISIPGRGGDQNGVYDSSSTVTYTFLINPSEVQISRQSMVDQSFTRSGWQIGVAGEDFISISMSGKTPGKYFQFGTTDYYSEFTESYRNLLALELLVENNGYWFEGEQLHSNLGSQQASKQIKMHSDVHLKVGEFVWSGLFETLRISEDANSPFLCDFSLNFTAWKETFASGSPYPDSIGGEIQRGHVPLKTTTTSPQSTTASVNTAATQDMLSNTGAHTTA